MESPAKASKLQNYLGDDYTVLASYGHVRNLVGKQGSVDPSSPEQDFKMRWGENEKQLAKIAAIQSAVAHATQVVLATDPDREGEAISWHICEVLQVRRPH